MASHRCGYNESTPCWKQLCCTKWGSETTDCDMFALTFHFSCNCAVYSAREMYNLAKTNSNFTGMVELLAPLQFEFVRKHSSNYLLFSTFVLVLWFSEPSLLFKSALQPPIAIKYRDECLWVVIWLSFNNGKFSCSDIKHTTANFGWRSSLSDNRLIYITFPQVYQATGNKQK